MANTKETRAAFAGLIDKPVLTDELLARPPFRFILDIVSSTAAKTGFLRDRFPVEALNPAKFKEKTDKTAFLDALIEAVNDGSLSTIKSSKIVAGKEPDLTNMLLIKLAEQAREFQSEHKQTKKRRSSSVEESKEKSGRSKHRSESKGKEKKKEEPKEKKEKEKKDEAKLKKPSKTKDPKEKTKEKKKKEEETTNGTDSGHHRSRSKEKDEGRKSSGKSSKRDKEKREEDLENQNIKEKDEGRKSSGKSSKRRKEETREEDLENQNIEENDMDNRDINSNVVETDKENRRNSIDEPITAPVETSKYSGDAQSSERTDDSGISDMVESPQLPPTLERLPSARPHTSMARPGTAASRPAPPKLKRKQIAVTEEITATPQNVVLISETADKEKSTPEENFLVEEEEVLPEFHTAEVLDPNEQRGGLVQKMIETTTVLKETNLNDTGDVDEGMMAKERLKTEAFSNSLQTVTRTVYPLSRIFDFAQEDLELMVKELDKWLNDVKKSESLLKSKDAQGLGDSHKLSTVLASLEEDVNSMRSMVNASKARITANNRRIQEVLNNI